MSDTPREKETKTKLIEHPLEAELGIESGTTLVEYSESVPATLVADEKYDNKDNEIEEQFQEVYEKAMDAFDEQFEEAQRVEGKYKARGAEVASQFLNTALSAAREKKELKQHKDKLEVAQQRAGTPNTVNQNLIVDRNDILRAIQGRNEEDDEA